MADDLNTGWQICARKVPYSTRKFARDAAARLGRREACLFRPYACRICGAFHLATAKEKR